MRLPTPPSVAVAFSRTLGLPCQAIEGQAIDFIPRSRAVLSPLLNALGGAQALVICDQELAVLVVGAVREQGREHLQEALSAPCFLAGDLGALQGVLAPLAALLCTDETVLKMGVGCADPHAARSPDVEAVLQAPANRLELQVTVQGYGSGRLSLLIA
jgi:hypothetical protein